jgi:hypothetical protein
MATHVDNLRYRVSGQVTASTNFTNGNPLQLCLNQMTEGTDEVNRVGDKMRWKRFMFKAQVFSNASLVRCQAVRLVIIRESSSLGSVTSLNQYMDSSTPDASTAMINVQTRNHHRFHVVYDSGSFLVGPFTTPVANTTYTSLSVPDTWLCDVDLPVDFVTDYSRGNAGTVADIDTNAVTLLAFTDNGTANGLTVVYQVVMEGIC